MSVGNVLNGLNNKINGTNASIDVGFETVNEKLDKLLAGEGGGDGGGGDGGVGVLKTFGRKLTQAEQETLRVLECNGGLILNEPMFKELYDILIGNENAALLPSEIERGSQSATLNPIVVGSKIYYGGDKSIVCLDTLTNKVTVEQLSVSRGKTQGVLANKKIYWGDSTNILHTSIFVTNTDTNITYELGGLPNGIYRDFIAVGDKVYLGTLMVDATNDAFLEVPGFTSGTSTGNPILVGTKIYWGASQSSGSTSLIKVIDTTTNTGYQIPLSSTRGIGNPILVGTKIYWGTPDHFSSSTLTVLDTANDTVSDIVVPKAAYMSLVYGNNGKIYLCLYAAVAISNKIIVINTANDTVSEIPLSLGQYIRRGFLVGTKVFFPNNTTIVIDTADDSVIEVPGLSGGEFLNSLIVYDNYIYIGSRDNRDFIHKINTKTNEVEVVPSTTSKVFNFPILANGFIYWGGSGLYETGIGISGEISVLPKLNMFYISY